jgi:acyl phosphate:glycerol-3-phosphate acyltransferase
MNTTLDIGGILSALAGAVAAYLIGSFPTGLIVGRLFFNADPRNAGSGATGATNIFRLFGAGAGILVTLVDIAKGAFAVLAISALGASSGVEAMPLSLAGAFLAVLGHAFPVFAGFRGGKGVATGAGALLVIAPMAALFSAAGFLLVIGSTGIVSAASMTAAIILPIAIAGGAEGSPPSSWLLCFGIILALFVLFTHRANIGRILKSEEKAFENIRFLRSRKKR